MKVSIQKQIGKSVVTFESDNDDFKEALAEAIKRSDAPEECGLCKSKDLSLRQYKTKDGNFLYVKIQCNACQAASTLGSGKVDKTNFWWKEFEKFEGSSNQPEAVPEVEATEETSSSDGSDDLPF